MSRVAALLVILACAALSPAVAHAGEASGGPPGSDRGLRLGERTFGVPACGHPVIAYATFGGPHLMAGGDEERCRILLNADFADDMPKAMVCTLVFHEWGHLAGEPHSDEPGSIMAAEYVKPDKRCVTKPKRRAARKRQ